MKSIKTLAETLGVLTNWKSSAPMLALALLLSVSLVATGCGTQSRADTADDQATEASDESQDEAAEADSDADGESEGEDGEEKEAIVAVPVSVSPVESGSVSAYLTATANLVAENEVKVLAESSGRVARLLVDEGIYVRKGQLLASLVADDQKIGLAKAEFKETNARLAFERGNGLAQQELISREEIDRLSMDHELAKQELAEAQWRIKKTEIRAPFSGQITERMIQMGQHVQDGTELFQITDFDPLIARIYLPETDVMGLEDGREVRITLNANSKVQFTGRIRHVSQVVDTSTGTVKVTVEAPGAPQGVRPGSFVTVGIVRETRANILKLPKDAVIRELRSAHVFVVKDDVAEKRKVTLGLEEGAWVEAMTGVNDGDQVIVLGQGGLKDGSQIKILAPDGSETKES
jgi:membrane fusion protein (multidrug efflux system)